MGHPVIVLAVLLALAVVGVLLVALRARRAAETNPTAFDAASPIMRLEPGELAALEEPSVDLDTVMADAGPRCTSRSTQG